MKRTDDYPVRSSHLKSLTDAELNARFWELLGELVDPLLKLGYENTTPAIERSVLLRMGFSSLEAKSIVDGCLERNLLAHGAGNVVYRYAKHYSLPVREAGIALAEGSAWKDAEALFEEVAK